MLPAVALTIAGSDNSAGAGAQADLKTWSAHGVYGLTAITCVVAEVPGQVSAIQPMTPEIVAEQMRLSFAAFPVAAVKTGLLFSREIIEVVCDALEGRAVPLVVDPVMIASSGDRLLREDAVELYEQRLFRGATVITPNLDEAAALLHSPMISRLQMGDAAATLARRYDCAVLLKGGHLRESVAVDVLFSEGAMEQFSAPWVEGVSTHGTGCTYAAAIAAGLAQGRTLSASVARAKQYVTRAISQSFRWPNAQALNHSAFEL